jgi:hypothetical protein
MSQEMPCDDSGDAELVDFFRIRNQQEEEEVPIQKEEGQYVITMDTPFLNHILQLAHTNIQDESEIHELIEKLKEISYNHKTLTMDDYNAIQEFEGGSEDDTEEHYDEDEINPEEEEIYSNGPISVESLLAMSRNRNNPEEEKPTSPYAAPRTKIEGN